MVRAAYLLRQAEVLLAMSRATFDLGTAGRLRAMASEFQARANGEEEAAKEGEFAAHSGAVLGGSH
jgi:hypothetical protein